MRRALVVGEALVDVVEGGAAHPGGSPLNVAVGLARLGVPTTLFTRVGRDAHGSLVRDHLDASGVVLGDGSVHGDRTSTAVVDVDAEGRAEYRFDLVSELPTPGVAHAGLVHAGSIAAFAEPGAAVVRATFARTDADTLLSFDPNIRPGAMGEREDVLGPFEAYAARAHVVKLSDEDAAWLYPSLGLDAVLARLVGLGTGLAVVTRGAEGCLALAALAAGGGELGGAFVERPAAPVRLVDSIGAGDAFMSGLLAALLGAADGVGADGSGSGSGSDPWPVGRALLAGRADALEVLGPVLDAALASAAITVSRAGANPPSARELEARLQADFAG